MASIYCCLVKMGHQGHKKYREEKVLIESRNAVEAMRIAKLLPGVKKGIANFQGQNVLEVYPIEQSRVVELMEDYSEEDDNFIYNNRNI
jgi:hypothetical protein